MVTDEQLLAAGFEQSAEGTLVKRLKAVDMPYVNEHIVDDLSVFERTEVLVEVSSDRIVKMTIPTCDEASEPRLLRDAGVKS